MTIATQDHPSVGRGGSNLAEVRALCGAQDPQDRSDFRASSLCFGNRRKRATCFTNPVVEPLRRMRKNLLSDRDALSGSPPRLREACRFHALSLSEFAGLSCGLFLGDVRLLLMHSRRLVSGAARLLRFAGVPVENPPPHPAAQPDECENRKDGVARNPPRLTWAMVQGHSPSQEHHHDEERKREPRGEVAKCVGAEEHRCDEESAGVTGARTTTHGLPRYIIPPSIAPRANP